MRILKQNYSKHNHLKTLGFLLIVFTFSSCQTEVVKKTIELFPRQHWSYSFSMNQSGVLFSKIKVISGSSVDIELLPAEEFDNWKKGKPFKYILNHRGQNILEEKYTTRLEKWTEYVLILEPNRLAKSSTKVEIDISFKADKED